uniref:non-specific serine/threonine protein kinase n=1 Tax=Parascaris univalens TaxID=6257 RepID=A0A915AMW4_PARUN
MTAIAKSAQLRQIHSEPATVSSIQTDVSNMQIKGTQFDLPNVINGSMTTKNVYNPPLREQILREKLANAKLAKMDSINETSSMVRASSAQSLPVTTSEGVAAMTQYQRTLYMLANDAGFQKDVALGKRIGFYKLGKELGAGNFSKVKLGVHVLTKEKVAVKIMEKAKMDQKAQRLLAREIKSMEDLHHPNIIRLFECVETISRTFLMMEYAGGGELYAFVQERGKLSEDDAKPLYAQIVAAVVHMHSKDIVHRDIKAENVIFAHPGWVKLADFGFSCQVENGAYLSTFCGSPPYAAPELFQDKDYSGPMVDIWAMGVLLYFMLVGVTPFRGETLNDLTQNILKGVYSMPDYLSTFAQHLINRMLEANPNRRLTVLDVKKAYWLRESKFPRSYVQCSTVPNEEELDTSSVARNVWHALREYGIDEKMMREAAPKGARNAIIGTYRIVLYQSQVKDDDKERNKVKDHQLLQQASKNQTTQMMINKRSKTCALL